ncbi:hypothetical protein JCM10908_005922 [Rhodotorula pacifica]|uniref:uncharacterized protein n=1 Tax=Rhodotorula pacifica TaxID=1495444 RepID=UPI00316E689D
MAAIPPTAPPAAAGAVASLDASDHDARNNLEQQQQEETPLDSTADATPMESTPASSTGANGVLSGEKRTRAEDGDTDEEEQEVITATSATTSKGKGKGTSTPASGTAKPRPRARPRASDAGPAKKKRRSFAPGTPTAWCHQDHQPHDLNEEVLLHCMNRKTIGKPKPDATEPQPTKACTIKYCEKCLEKHYGVNARQVVESGEAETWTCYVCRGECNCTSCRRKLLGETSTEVQALSHPGGLFDKEPEVIDVAGGRSAAKAAKARMTATLAIPPKAAQSGDGESGKKGKKRAKANAGKDRMAIDGAVSDSSLSDLTDSDAEQAGGAGGKSRRKSSAAMKKTDSAARSVTADGQKRVMPPRPPAALPPAPPTRALASVYYPHATLPVDDSILARMHVREFYLRFLHLMPSIAPPSTGKGPTAQLARVLSSLSDDILWLWTDHDSAAELVQLRLLGGVVELLLRERITTIAIHKLQREKLDDLQNQVHTAVAGIQRHREVYDLPWRTAREVLTIVQKSRGRGWVGIGLEWEKQAKARRDAAEKAKKGGEAAGALEPAGAVTGEGEGADGAIATAVKKDEEGDPNSDLSSLSDASSVAGDEATAAAAPANGAAPSIADSTAASTTTTANGSGSGAQHEEDEVDQLASDYEEPPRPIGSPEKKRRRKKGERETPAEERLALICGLIELSYDTELIRADFAKAADVFYREMVENNKDRIAIKKEMNERKAELTTKKTELEKPAGNNASTKVKEFYDEQERIEDEIKEAEVTAKKESWRVQHEYVQIAARNRLRFEHVGQDTTGNLYYILTLPPAELLNNPASATSSSFPLDRRAEDDGKRDYPLSYSIVGYGTRPAAAPAPPAPSRQSTPVKKEASVEPGSASASADANAAATASVSSKEWFVVYGIDELDALADWVDSTTEHVDWAIRLAEFQLEHPKTKQNGKYLPPPDPQVVASLRTRLARMDWDLVDRLRQFADAMKWEREKAALKAQGGVLPRVRAGKGRRSP